MSILQDTPVCPEHNDGFVFGYFYDIIADDQYVGLYLYMKARVRLIHCGSFHSGILTSGSIVKNDSVHEFSYFDRAISFHWITDEWLSEFKLSTLKKRFNFEER